LWNRKYPNNMKSFAKEVSFQKLGVGLGKWKGFYQYMIYCDFTIFLTGIQECLTIQPSIGY